MFGWVSKKEAEAKQRELIDFCMLLLVDFEFANKASESLREYLKANEGFVQSECTDRDVERATRAALAAEWITGRAAKCFGERRDDFVGLLLIRLSGLAFKK